MSYISNIEFYREAYARGENVTELLKEHTGSLLNSATIIETAYDLQAGSYIDAVEMDLNPTAALVLKKKKTDVLSDLQFVDPINHQAMVKKDSFYYSPTSGVSFPIIDGIPVLRDHNAILTTALG